MSNEDNYLNRRAAFWDNWRHDLDVGMRDFNAQGAGKFVDDDDKQVIKTVNSLLQGALLCCMRRYHKVLGEQINAMEVHNE